MDLEGLMSLLGERLVQHNNNKREIQDKLNVICSGESSTADSLEKKLVGEIQEKFEEAGEHTLSIANKLSNIKDGDDSDDLIEQSREELVLEQKFEIKHVEYAKTFLESYSLVVKKEKRTNLSNERSVEDKDRIINAANDLQEHLDKTHEPMITPQDKVIDICAKRRI